MEAQVAPPSFIWMSDSLADLVHLLKREKETCLICGFSRDNMPGEDALGRFLKKLVKNAGMFDGCWLGMAA